MLEPPKYLIINLKRFIQSGLGFIKNQKKISFPMMLTLDDFTVHIVHKDYEEELKRY